MRHISSSAGRTGTATLLRRVPVAAFLLGCNLLPVAALTQAQTNRTTSPPMQNEIPGMRQMDDRNDLFRNREMFERLQRARETERQKRIVDDSNRLVVLTSQYRKSLEAHGTPTEEDQKLLVQIEKLAREVKDRMKGM